MKHHMRVACKGFSINDSRFSLVHLLANQNLATGKGHEECNVNHKSRDHFSSTAIFILHTKLKFVGTARISSTCSAFCLQVDTSCRCQEKGRVRCEFGDIAKGFEK